MNDFGDIYVKDSPIHGKGVFAKRLFKTGEVVIPWNEHAARKLTAAELEALPLPERDYVSLAIEGEVKLLLPPARYVNHSCDANTRAKPEGDVATRPIVADEEITAQYENEYQTTWSMTCNCRAPNCKGIIRGRILASGTE